MGGLLDMLAQVKEHRFHSFDAPQEPAPAPKTEVHYVFSDVGHFEGAIDQAFNSIDADGSGTIEPSELLAELERRGLDVSEDRVKHLFSLYANEDGVLKVMEFADLAANLKRDDC